MMRRHRHKGEVRVIEGDKRRPRVYSPPPYYGQTIGGAPVVPPSPQPDLWAVPEVPNLGAPVAVKSPAVLAIIPTAGKDLALLKTCLASLSKAAGRRGNLVRPIVVVCPATGPELRQVLTLTAGTVTEVVSLPGPFSYPGSVNAGLARKRTAETHVLLLNDDVEFTQPDSLWRLLETMQANRWGCVGPWLRDPVSVLREDTVRIDGARQVTEPIVGACSLWDAKWLSRTGPFDLRFGEGYGHDESDQHLRGRNLGMTWGREERVLVTHVNHASFGDDACQRETEFYRTNVRAWEDKWGPIHTWGEGNEWRPLPGVQVVLAGHNVGPWVSRCLASVEAALEGFRWTLVFADDASTDDTWEKVTRHKSGADAFLRFHCPEKAVTAAQAKNRALAVSCGLQGYPAVVLMDADDVMTPERVRLLLPAAVNSGAPLVHGGFRYVGGSSDGQVIGPNGTQQAEGWLSPCSTLIHRSLVPADGRLFSEDLPAWEDAELWLRWWLKGLHSRPVPGPVVHEYHVREGSVMTSEGMAKREALWADRRRELLAGYASRR